MKTLSKIVKSLTRRCRGVNPFDGDCQPARVRIVGWGRPSLPFPHFWNYREPIRILDTYFWNIEKEQKSGRHNRYLDAFGFPLVLVTRDPGIIKSILSSTGDKPGQFDRDTLPTDGIARATGSDSLLYSNGSIWRTQKKLAAPSFGRSNLFQPEKFHEFEETFRKTAAQRLEQLRAHQMSTGLKVTRIELEPEISAVMLEMLVNNFFGASVPYEELRHRFVPSLTHLIDYMVSDTITHSMLGPFRFLRSESAKIKQARIDFEELTDIAISGRATGLGLWKQFKSDASDDELRSNIRVFLAGALEATTSFASWALSHLSRAPGIQDKVHDEVRLMDVYDPDNLAQAVELRQVLEETLRLTPSLYFLPRRTTVDTWVETADERRMFIPQDTHVLLDVWHANRNEEFWGEDISNYPADAFAPERWKILSEKGYSPKEILHFGFGFGPRTCPGISLGLLEVGLVVGAFVKMFRFTAVNEKTEARAGVSTKPDDGVLVDLNLREPYMGTI